MSPATAPRWSFAVIMTAIALYHLARLARSRWHRRRCDADVELTHAAMGLTMAVMAAGNLSVGTSGRLAAVFAVPTLWFGVRTVHSYVMSGPQAMGRHFRQCVGCAAMLFMLAGSATTAGAAALAHTGRANAPMPDMAMASTGASAAHRLIAGTLAAAILAVTLGTLAANRRTGPRPPATEPGGVATPTLAAGCQFAMNAAAVCMLVNFL
jgi:hypothetical protein